MKTIITTRLPEYNLGGDAHVYECQNVLNLKSIKDVTISHVFEFKGLDSQDFDRIVKVFENDLNTVSFELPKNDIPHFHIKAVDGQFDATLERVETQVKELCEIDTEITHSLFFSFPNALEEEVKVFKKYFVNPYEYVAYDTEYQIEDTYHETNQLDAFIELNDEELKEIMTSLAMDFDDLKVTQDYFKSINRNPSMTELKIIDTYWSDHCRHTTFLTHLDDIVIEDERVKFAYDSYLESRKAVYTDRVKPMTLMDLATINAKEINRKGLLGDWDNSDEVNAISLNVDINVAGEKEGWQLLFKNETHNHPTEIEPYGGASTCFGGCVRDPLSGRGMVYQGMRISGSKSPLTTLENTRAGKLMARRICQEASEGYSDYSNQIGIKSGYAKEYYHDGFEAKRLELGALVAAVKREYIQKSEPEPGDFILLIGGKTGRDGLGAAVGSSKTQTKSSLLTAGAEVQKGNPVLEHKIVRLFRNPEALRLIKRCNDFGAGGVAVAIGELADGLRISLDQVPTKYPLHGGEIALSESQERMAVVVKNVDAEKFIKLCDIEDVEATIVAEVTEEKVMRMTYKGRTIVSLDRSFLDSNGATKTANVLVKNTKKTIEPRPVNENTLKDAVTNIHGASQRGMREKFSASVMASGLSADNIIAQEGMISTFPVSNTDAVSMMGCGYPVTLSEDPFLHGYMSVVEAISRVVAMGGNPKNIRLSMQEYFERLTSNEKWGKPFAALLGAFEVMKAWDVPALGGKDSMSGTFEELSVPASLITFALQHGTKDHVVTRNLKEKAHKIVWVKPTEVVDGLLDLEELMAHYETVHQAILDRKVYSASTLTVSMFNSLFEMALGSDLGLDIVYKDTLLDANIGGLLLEVDMKSNLGQVVAYVTDGNTIKVGDITFDKVALQKEHEETFEAVYPILKFNENIVSAKGANHEYVTRDTKPTACLIMMQGVNGDFDTRLRLEETGFDVKEAIIRFFDYKTSLNEVKEMIEASDVVVLPHGFVKDDEITVSGKEWDILFNHPILKETFDTYQGTILGIGSGALGLIEMGCLGDVSVKPIGKHHYTSEVKVVSDHASVVANLLDTTVNIPMNIPYGLEDYDETLSILEQVSSPVGCKPSIGLAKGNVVAVLGSIDQIESDFFSNLKTFKEEIA